MWGEGDTGDGGESKKKKQPQNLKEPKTWITTSPSNIFSILYFSILFSIPLVFCWSCYEANLEDLYVKSIFPSL